MEKLTLEQRFDGPVWVISYQGGGSRRADPATGTLLPPVGAAEAARLAMSYYGGNAAQTSVRRCAADSASLDLRTSRPSWRVGYADGTRLYIDADTGGLLALRTDQWRIYDFMCVLHIMRFTGPRGQPSSNIDHVRVARPRNPAARLMDADC